MPPTTVPACYIAEPEFTEAVFEFDSAAAYLFEVQDGAVVETRIDYASPSAG